MTHVYSRISLRNDADVFTGVDLDIVASGPIFKITWFFHRGPSTKDSEKWLSLYADCLRSIPSCYILTFGKLSMLTGSKVHSIVTYLLSEN